MSKERLEELAYHVAITSNGKAVMNGEDYAFFYEFALEQAERVQELENILDQDARQDVIEGLYEENRRYREALNKIRNLTETDAGAEEEVFIIADNILLESGD